MQSLVVSGEVRVSEHGWDELEADDISLRDVIVGLAAAHVVEDYPEFGKGPSVLVLQLDRDSKPVHVVWGVPKGYESPAILITAYRPDPRRWDESFTRRQA